MSLETELSIMEADSGYEVTWGRYVTVDPISPDAFVNIRIPARVMDEVALSRRSAEGPRIVISAIRKMADALEQRYGGQQR